MLPPLVCGTPLLPAGPGVPDPLALLVPLVCAAPLLPAVPDGSDPAAPEDTVALIGTLVCAAPLLPARSVVPDPAAPEEIVALLALVCDVSLPTKALVGAQRTSVAVTTTSLELLETVTVVESTLSVAHIPVSVGFGTVNSQTVV